MKVSVALAAYKGEKYIGEQLKSILPQLSENDEIIVSDDFFCEAVQSIIDEIDDGRISYVKGAGKGVIKNFENAINLCSGDIIFLCDQDDVWLPNKVESCLKEFEDGAMLVLHDAKVSDSELNIKQESFFVTHSSSVGFLKNLMRNSYMGCCMAFSKELKKYILPFPEKIPMHDQWIGLNAERVGKVSLIREPLIIYRRHSETVTGGKTGAFQKLLWRVQIVKALLFKRCGNK